MAKETKNSGSGEAADEKAQDDGVYRYGIRILRDGTWLYGGTPIARLNLVKLFSSVLKRKEDGHYWLETPAERGRIEVEDVPFVAVEMRVTGEGRDQALDFRTNIDVWVQAGDGIHDIRTGLDAASGAHIPYIMVSPGIEARIVRAVYYALADIAVQDADGKGAGVWSRGKFYLIGMLPDGGV